MDSFSGIHSEPTDMVPLVITILVVVLFFAALYKFMRIDVAKQKLNNITLAVCLGQIVVALQALSVFSNLQVFPALPIVYSAERERLVTEVGREGGRGGERGRGIEGRGGEQRYTKKLFGGRLNRLFIVWGVPRGAESLS